MAKVVGWISAVGALGVLVAVHVVGLLDLGTLLAGQPYAVGLWHMGLERNTLPGCLTE